MGYGIVEVTLEGVALSEEEVGAGVGFVEVGHLQEALLCEFVFFLLVEDCAFALEAIAVVWVELDRSVDVAESVVCVAEFVVYFGTESEGVGIP